MLVTVHFTLLILGMQKFFALPHLAFQVWIWLYGKENLCCKNYYTTYAFVSI